MGREALEQLIERWMEDDAFRTAIRKDPEGTIRATGLELTAEEWQAVRNLDWSLTDEELSTRASKACVADGSL